MLAYVCLIKEASEIKNKYTSEINSQLITETKKHFVYFPLILTNLQNEYFLKRISKHVNECCFCQWSSKPGLQLSHRLLRGKHSILLITRIIKILYLACEVRNQTLSSSRKL